MSQLAELPAWRVRHLWYTIHRRSMIGVEGEGQLPGRLRTECGEAVSVVNSIGGHSFSPKNSVNRTLDAIA